jgi:hypothetical protein
MTKTILGTVAAAAIAIAAIAAPAKAKASVLDKIFGPKAVDFTFSLECRALESNWNQTIHLPEYDAVSKFEQDHGVAPYANGTDDGVESYYPQGRIAFNHGEPDGTSLPAIARMYVVKVTPEGITLQGKSDIGSSKGFFDRRTGHGIITEFKKYGKGDLALGGEPGETVHEQWIFECKPSAPAKF